MNAKRMRNYYDMFAIMFNSQKSYRKYIENTHLGLLTETHEYYFGSLKHQIFIYSRWRHPPKTVSPRPYCRSRRGRNGLGSETRETVSSSDGPRLQRTASSTLSFHILSLSGMLYLQGMICHSSNPKSSLLTCVMAVHSTNHALTAVIMILKDRNSLYSSRSKDQATSHP